MIAEVAYRNYMIQALCISMVADSGNSAGPEDWCLP
jgi:hypothetical protein